jgi:hypothetical protein
MGCSWLNRILTLVKKAMQFAVWIWMEIVEKTCIGSVYANLGKYAILVYRAEMRCNFWKKKCK